MTKYNAPGNPKYVSWYPIDPDLRSTIDQELRGYWLAREKSDDQACLVSNQNQADHLRLGKDPDGYFYAAWTDLTTEFSFDEEESAIRIARYA